MITYIPKPGDWKSIGMVNNHLTWLAIKPNAQVFVFGYHQHVETYHFEKATRISLKLGKDGQKLQIKPENALTKRTAVA